MVADKKGITPLAKITHYHSNGVKPELVMYAPIPNIKGLLKMSGLSAEDIDLYDFGSLDVGAGAGKDALGQSVVLAEIVGFFVTCERAATFRGAPGTAAKRPKAEGEAEQSLGDGGPPLEKRVTHVLRLGVTYVVGGFECNLHPTFGLPINYG